MPNQCAAEGATSRLAGAIRCGSPLITGASRAMASSASSRALPMTMVGLRRTKRRAAALRVIRF